MATPVYQDIEAGFVPQSSPQVVVISLDGPPRRRQRASIPRLLVASMPRMITSIALNAQLVAVAFAYTSLASSVISVLGPLMSLLMSPIVGSLSDRCRNKWGRRRPYLVFSTLAMVLVLFISCFIYDIASVFDGYESAPYIAVVFYLFTAMLINFIDVPCMLLVADLAGNRQFTGAALGQGWSILGSVFVAVYFKLFGDVSSAGSFVAVCCVLMLIIVTIVGCNISETPREPSEATAQVFSDEDSPAATSSSSLTVYGCIMVLLGYGLYTYANNRLLFFNTRVASDSDEYYYYSSDSNLGDFKYFIVQQVAAYVFTWIMPFLTNKIGATSVLSISLVSQALLIIMAFVHSKTLVGLIDFAVTAFRGTIFVLVVPAVVHVYGANKNIGSRVGFLSSVGSIGELIAIAIGSSILSTDIGVQLPVLLSGIIAAIALVMSGCMWLQLKSL